MRGCHLAERPSLQCSSKIQLRISFFQGYKYSWTNSLHIYSLPADATYLAKFHQYRSWLFSVLQNGLFFKNNRQSREKNTKTITVWYTFKTLRHPQRYQGTSLSVIAWDAINVCLVFLCKNRNSQNTCIY